MNRGFSHLRAPLPAAAVSAATILVLAGCIGAPTEPKPPVATIDEVTVPDSILPTQPRVWISPRVIPGSESLPWLVGGALSEPGKGGVPTVWTSDDGGQWEAHAVADDFEGSFSGLPAASDDLAALGGTAWRGGELSSVLWTSEDREEWTARELPEEFASTYRIGDVAVTGSTVYAIGQDSAGVARGIRVEGETVDEFDLPAVDEGELLGASQVLAHDDALVLLASPGPEGDARASVSYVSEDGGATWGDAGEIAPRPAFVSGIARVEDGLVATGGTVRDSTSNATGIAAWFSAGGRTWTPEQVPGPAPDGPLAYSGSADAWLGMPLAGPSGLTALMANYNAEQSGIYTRSAAGGWALAGMTSANPRNGGGGAGISVDGATTVALLGGDAYARLGSLAGGAWTDTTTLAPREDLPVPSAIYPSEERSLVTMSTGRFTVGADGGWTNKFTYDLGEVSGSELALVPWDPEPAARLSGVQLGSDESGAEVVIGSLFDPAARTIIAEGWFRSGSEAPWTPAVGFATTGATSFSNVQKVGDQWIAVGTTRASSNVGDIDHATVWTSADGVTWTSPEGEFGDGSLESSAVDVCTLPEGGGIAVGWVEESASEYRTAVWQPGDAGWGRADIGDLGSSAGYATACASDDAGVILAATVGGRDTLLRSTDGSTWDEVFRAGRGIALGEPVAVSGGFAASGSYTTSSFSGPVVWLSADGVDWKPVAIPSFDQGSTLQVAPYGDDLLVTMPSWVGHPVSILRNIEGTISDYAG